MQVMRGKYKGLSTLKIFTDGLRDLVQDMTADTADRQAALDEIRRRERRAIERTQPLRGMRR